MSCEHKISIGNLKNNELVTQRLIIIRGSINRRCNLLRGSVINLTTGSEECFDLIKGNTFKILWCLQEGLNHIQVKYCQAIASLNINYTEAKRKRSIQPLYIVCEGHDGHFNARAEQNNSAEEACRKITLGLELVQCLYAEKLLEHGFERMSFTLNSDCKIFPSQLPADSAKRLDETALWTEFGREILNSDYGKDENLKFVAFIGCTEYETIEDGNYSYSNIKQHTKAQANLGGGGLALFGSGYLYCWPSYFEDILSCFEDDRSIDLKRFLDDSNYRRTYGGCYATTIGAVCHELGHVFDLGHTTDGIMGNGFDYVNLVFTSKQLTENLPNRIVVSSENFSCKDQRLTAIKRPGKFLEKYHEQKAGDSTFFTRNCAVILSLHRWINLANSNCTNWDIISLEIDSATTVAINSPTNYLRLIEIREKHSNLVVDYLDLSSKTNLRSINLSGKFNSHIHCLFAITSDGSTKYFA